MAEIMARRYGEKDWPVPDLIIIDGGKGQLHAALPIIRDAGCEAPVISLAKRIEEVFVEGSSDSIILSHHTPELQLLQSIRDEAIASPLPTTATSAASAVWSPSWTTSKASAPSGEKPCGRPLKPWPT